LDPTQIDPKKVDLEAVANWTMVLELKYWRDPVDSWNLFCVYAIPNIVALARGESAESLALAELNKARDAYGLSTGRLEPAGDLPWLPRRWYNAINCKVTDRMEAHLSVAKSLAFRVDDPDWRREFDRAVHEFDHAARLW
jgi:hypothetical protein